MFVVFFRLFLLVCITHGVSVLSLCVNSFFFQFCFIFIMGSTKGNTIAILFDTSMVSFGFDMASARSHTRVYLYEMVHAGVVYFDKATSDRRKHTMTIIQNVKTKLIILFVWFFVQFWFQLCVHGHKSSELASIIWNVSLLNQVEN